MTVANGDTPDGSEVGPSFPLDEVTLVLLAEACRIGDDGRSHLSDFLKMGAGDPAAPCVCVKDEHFIDATECARHAGGWTPQAAIEALVGEVQKLRAAWANIESRLRERFAMAREVLDKEGYGDVATLVPIEEVLIWIKEING